MSENKKYDGINEGTKIKAILQLRAIEFLKEYEPKQTLDFYAKLLCWDIHTTYRTALDSYIMPMLCHGYFIYNGDDKYTFNENRKSNSKIKKGKITKDSVENQESATDFMKRRKAARVNRRLT